MKKIKSIKKRIAGIITVSLAALFLMLTAFPGISASAAGASVKLSAPQNPKKGESFTVTATFSADKNIGSVKARIDYDDRVIEFVSGEFASGGGGLCLINGWSDPVGKTSTYELTFKVVGEGSSNITIESSSIYSDIGDLLGSPTAETSVSVKGQNTAQATTTTVAAGDPAVTTTTSQTVTEQQSVTTAAPDVPAVNTGNEGTGEWQDPALTEDPEGNITAEEEAVVTDEDGSEISSVSSQAEDSDTKGAVTAILLIVGGVAIASILMMGDGGKKRSRRR